MSSRILILLILTFASIAFAANTQILKCAVTNDEWQASFALNTLGAGALEFKKSGDAHYYKCALKLDYMQDGSHAVTPEIKVDFSRATCTPDLGPRKNEILENLHIIAHVHRSVDATVQWLTAGQPDNCRIEKFRLSDIEIGAKKFGDGSWGRSTASEKPSEKLSEKPTEKPAEKN